MSIDLVGSHLAVLDDQEQALRLQRIRRAWEAYDGNAPRPFISNSDEGQDNVRLNFNRTLVDKGVAFLFGKPIHLGLGEDGGERTQAREDQLAEFWRVSGGRPFFRKLAKNGGIAGHAFAKLQPPSKAGDSPRAIVLDPSNLEVFYDEEDIEAVYEYRIEWLARDRDTGRVKVRRQSTILADNELSWEIIDEVSEESGAHFREIDRVTWAYEWAPIFHCQNLDAPNEFWGRADLEPDVLDLVESLERVASDMKRVVRLYGHPMPWATGTNLMEIDASIGALLQLPDGANVGQLEMSAALQGPLALWKELKGALHEITRTPEVASGKVDNIGNLSGVALEILYGPMVEKNEEKRDSYGEMVRDLSQRALELMGVQDARPSINWPEVLPADPDREMAALDAAEAMGVVSKQTVAERLGFDYEQEKERIATETDEVPDEPPLPLA